MLGLASHEPEGTWVAHGFLPNSNRRISACACPYWLDCLWLRRYELHAGCQWCAVPRISSILLQPWCGGLCWKPAPRRYPRPSEEVFPRCGV